MAGTEAAAPPDSSEAVLGEVAEEFERENQEVLYPLLERINEMASALSDGRHVDPEYIELGVRLWARYVSGLHESRLSRLEEIIRFAPSVVAASGARKHRIQLRRSRLGERTAVDDPLTAEYKEIRGTQARMAERIAVLEGLITAYRRGDFFADQTLASILRSGAYSDRAWAKYEEEFVLKSLGEHLDAEEGLLLHREVAEASAVRGQSGSDVRSFLASPMRVLPPSP